LRTYQQIVRTRLGEACGLRWADIDLETGVGIVSRSIITTGAGGYLEKDTKTHAIRKLALDVDTIALLNEHRSRMTARATACGTTLADDVFMFSESADAKRPWHPDTPTARFVFDCGTTLVSTTCDSTTCATCTPRNSSRPAYRFAPSLVASDTPTLRQRSTSTHTSSRRAITSPRP
jgi:hypothetical protein